ncbi:MAG: 5-oxoprolinase subunit PxpB [Nocardioidaceae bacterium]|nr:5-oxoprolinase subunit PxpB [Nocardioidaceae bacterium]
MDIRSFGPDHVLVEVEDSRHSLAVYEEARRRRVEAASIVPAAATVLFEGVADVEALVRSLPGWEVDRADVAGETVEVPTTYDGEDLDGVAHLWGMTRDEVVRTHTSTEFVVAFCGFAPGFAYCTGLPDDLAVPRLETPRTRVPAGSVGLAGSYTGVYPTASPGGWRLIGRTDLVLWDVERDPPATLVPGTQVRFTAA